MILQSLNQLYDRLADDQDYEIAKPGYSPQNISFRILLKPDGSFLTIEDARCPDTKGKLRASKQIVIGDSKPPGPGINPGFLWDNMAYMLGYKKDDPKPSRTHDSFEAFRDAHLACEKELNHPHFSAVCRFLENWTPTLAIQYAAENPLIAELSTGFGLFSIQGEAKPVNELPEILTWWDSKNSETQSTFGQCLITGILDLPIARLHPKIKSVTGAQSSGALLVSFDKPSYKSYQKDQSFNAPVSEKAAFQYGTALNSLLSGPQSSKHRIRIGDTTCVFWTDKPSFLEDAFGLFANEGSNALDQAQDAGLRNKVEILLKQIRIGGENAHDIENHNEKTRFYLLGLAPNAARLSVRFFHQSTVGEFISNLRSHHRDITIIREWEEAKGKRLPDPEFPAYWQLLSQTARVSDEIPPLLGGALMRSVLQNTPYPEALYTSVLRRIRADRTINYLRACIIKGVLTRNPTHKLNKPITTMLDLENNDPAYLLGRLFATLEKTQQDALGDLNAGIRDKYYSSASTTPASVFPRILRTYAHHLAKLPGGAKITRDRLTQEILSGISASGFPSQLNLTSQGVFAIGYYHQRKDFYTKKNQAKLTSSETE